MTKPGTSGDGNRDGNGDSHKHTGAAVKRKVVDNDLANASANNDPGRTWMRVESAARNKSATRPRCQ